MKFSEMPYERINIEEACKKLQDITERAKTAKDGETQFAIHQEYYALMDEVRTMNEIAAIRHDGNTADEFYEKERDYYDEMMPVFENEKVKYEKVLYESPNRPYMEEKIGKVAFKNMELMFKSTNESVIPLKQKENALISRYTKLIASAKIPFEGEEYNISLLRPFLIHNDRDVRRHAWNALTDYFMSVTDEIDEIYDAMVKNRTEQAKLLGFDNYVELGYCRMGRNSYGRKEVEQFREQIKRDYVPFVSELHEKRRKRLGLDKLSYIDHEVYFNDGNPAPTGTPDEILNAGHKMYTELSGETKEFFEFMQENELFDVLGRKNKTSGGYMTYIPLYKAPFIFANFNATSGDVDVITHECGHAFQGYVVRNEAIREYMDITMETAEIHSMSMEYFAYPWMKDFFGERAGDYLTMHLEDSASFIPYGCMVDEFQHIVYEHPEMTPAERKGIWKDLEKVYRPHMDFEDNPFFGEGGWWQRQGHIFCDPFYYIDYCLASICAMEYKIKMDEDFDDAWQSYMKLCQTSARKFYVPMLESVGLQSPFEDGCIQNIVEKFKEKANIC